MSGHFIPTFWNGTQKADALTRTSDDQRMPDKNRFQAVIQAYENHGTDSRIKEIEISPTVTARWGTGGNNVPLAMQGNLIGRDKGGPNGVGVSDSNTMYTLTKTDIHAVAFDAYNNSVTGNITKTLDTGSDYHHVPNVYSPTMAVRRLTEVECERLQGFPDNYTNIRENCPSGARYKALGNSMAVPVMRWIGERINNYESI
jgi:DNA (cytosine-5)-methyltransferase 1